MRWNLKVQIALNFSYVEMESLFESVHLLLLIRALQYFHGIDGKFILSLCPVNISNGEGMFAVIGVHLYSIRPKFHCLPCSIE